MPTTHTSIHFHVVFSTKNREPLITEELREDLYGYLGGIVRNQGAICLAIGGIEDHIHLLIGFRSSHRLDYFMRELKAGSSGWVRKNRNPRFKWQNGYGAFAISPSNLEMVKQYIRNQPEHHKKLGFQSEYVEMLDRANVEYDEKFLW